MFLAWPTLRPPISTKKWISIQDWENYGFATVGIEAKFKGRLRLFFESDAIFGMPDIPGVVSDEKWNFDKNWKNNII